MCEKLRFADLFDFLRRRPESLFDGLFYGSWNVPFNCFNELFDTFDFAKSIQATWTQKFSRISRSRQHKQSRIDRKYK